MDPTQIAAQRLFEAARQLEKAEQKTAFLEIACGKDVELRRRVDALVQAEAQSGHAPRGAIADAAATTPAFTQQNAILTEGPGDQIGRYKLLQQIGEGGCGTVYLAQQDEPVRRRVALKVIKLGMDTRQVIARFEAERQALAILDHPNIAKVFDAGATGTGRPFFVMELVRGPRITDYCDQNNLSTADRLKLFVHVCQAIQHAHQKGIIHRDIKPSNVLVTLHDDVPVPKVIDFGIAKATTDQKLTDRTLFTALEQFVGTPAYMSPEQAEMSGLDIDTRTDIYSLGVLLYELLTGQTPFDARQLLAGGIDAMRRTIRDQEPARPSTRLGTMVAGELSTVARQRRCDPPRLISLLRGDLDWIVMKALEKDRTRRYQTANGFAMDIQRYLGNEPVLARPPSAFYRFQKLVRRNKVASLAVAAVASALLVGLGTSSWMFVRERQARQVAVAAQQKADKQAIKSRQVARFLQEMLTGVGPSVAKGRDATLLREILDKTTERIGKDLKTQPDIEAELQTTLGEVYLALGNYDQAESRFRQALDLQKKLFGEDHQEVAAALNNLAEVFHRRGRFVESEAIYRQALAIQKKVFGNEHAEIATSLNDLALVLELQDKMAEAEMTYRQALAMQRNLFGNDSRPVAASLNNLATVLKNEAKYAEAETLHRQALEIKRKILGNENNAVAISLVNLAIVLENQGKFSEAESAVREALEMRRKLFGEEHPAVANTLRSLVEVLEEEGDFGQAESVATQALRMSRKLYGQEHPDVAESLGYLAMVQDDQRQFAKAEATIREALDMQQKLLGNEHPDLADSYNILARVLAHQGKFTEAETRIQQALVIERKVQGNEHPDVALSLNELADILSRQSRFAEAEPPARECLRIREKKLPDNWRLFASRSALGACLSGQKNFVEAEPLLVSGYEGLKQRQDRIPAQDRPCIKAALNSLVEVASALGKAVEAAQYRKELGEASQWDFDKNRAGTKK